MRLAASRKVVRPGFGFELRLLAILAEIGTTISDALRFCMLTHARHKPRELPRRKSAGPIRARWHDELAPLEANWPDTNSYPASPAPSFAWLSAAQLAFSETAELRVLTAECDGRALAATALASVGHGPTWRWMPLGSELGEPTDLAGADACALECLARSLVGLGQPVVLERLPANSLAASAIRKAARGRAVVVKREADPQYGIELDESWVRPECHLSASERRQYQRSRREAESLGGLSTEIHTPDLFDLPSLLDLVFQCEGQRVVEDEVAEARRMSAIVFFCRYCEAACAAGILRIGLVRIAGRVAAAAIAVEQGSTFWLLRIASNARYEACQPGQLLMREILSYCAEAGVTRCELWGQRHDWLGAWPIIKRPCVRLNIYPLTLAGGLAASADGAAGLARRVRRLFT